MQDSIIIYHSRFQKVVDDMIWENASGNAIPIMGGLAVFLIAFMILNKLWWNAQKYGLIKFSYFKWLDILPLVLAGFFGCLTIWYLWI